MANHQILGVTVPSLLQRLLPMVTTSAACPPSLKPISQLPFDYDTTATRLRRKINMLIFSSRRIASNGSRRARHVDSRIVVVSQSNVISITSVVVECVVVSSYTTYRSLVVVESQL